MWLLGRVKRAHCGSRGISGGQAPQRAHRPGCVFPDMACFHFFPRLVDFRRDRPCLGLPSAPEQPCGGRGVGGGFQQHGLFKRRSDPVDAAPAPALSSLTSFDNFLLICRNANVFSEPQGPAGSGSAPVTLWTLATRPSLLLASAPGPLHIPGGDFSFLPHPVTSVHPLDLSSNRPR